MKNYPSIDYRSYRRSQEGGIPFSPSGAGVYDPEPVFCPLEKDWGAAELEGKKPGTRLIPFEIENILWVVIEIGILAGVVGLLFGMA